VTHRPLCGNGLTTPIAPISLVNGSQRANSALGAFFVGGARRRRGADVQMLL